MTEIIHKLDRQIEQIEYEKRKKNGCILEEKDIKLIFEILKEADKEIAPVLESFSRLCTSKLDDETYLIIEKELKSVLKYYNILDGCSIMTSRHQLFFTEERKVVKKPYFNKDNLDYIKNIFHEIGLFKKLGAA